LRSLWRGNLIKGIADLCSICQLLVHKKCAEIPRTIKIVLHNHLLNLIYSPHEINKRENMFCRICGNKVNTKYAAYNCEECSYHIHTECLRLSWDMYKEESPTTSESVHNNSVGRSTHIIKALNQAEDKGPHPEEIKHFSHDDHQLKLILCDDEVKDGKLCEGCTDFIISAPFYSCAQCQFFLHTRCAELPTTIEQYRLLYFCTLTLLPRHLPIVGCSFAIFVLAIIMASPTIVLNLFGFGGSLTFNAVQFRKRLNTKVINITFSLLWTLRIENAKLVPRTTRSMYSYAPVAISS
jgi:hypothetical protein